MRYNLITGIWLKANNYKLWLASIFLLFLNDSAHGQCDPPSLLQIVSRTTTTLRVSWNYPSTADGYELAIYEYGENPDLISQVGLITEQEYSFQDLNPGVAYTIFVRTVCAQNNTSEWNPISTTTLIGNPSPCRMTLPIKNNNCNQRHDEFLVQVTDIDGALGESVYLESVDLIIEHSWPSDLKLTLISPSGKEIILSSHNGTGFDNYGDIADTNCQSTTSFTDLACERIDEIPPPFIGEYRAEDDLQNIEDGTSPIGIWKLEVCDRSPTDAGFLKYINLNFSPLQCPLPQNIGISNVNGNEIEIEWSHFEDCNFLEVNVGLKDGNIDDFEKYSISCNQENFVIPDLLQDTEYDIYILSDCFDAKSPLSCPIQARTLCMEATLSTTFDDQSNCDISCTATCDIEDIWHNIYSDQQDWLIHNGSTPTTETGPDNDVYESGNYIYVESSPSICDSTNTAILESDCIHIRASESCSMSFWYHMHGSVESQLALLIYTEVTKVWDTLVVLKGNHENEWLQQEVNLSTYNNTAAKFRFIAQLGDTDRGDIAIDEIVFFGSESLGEGIVYYQDFDSDGFGNEGFPILLCSIDPGTGYEVTGDDCDDENQNVFPGNIEIPCNGVDENCNGMEDDALEENPIIYTYAVNRESCLGAYDASISLDISGGTPPYIVRWNTGADSSTLSDITSGIYFAEIIDFGGCTLQTEFIEIESFTGISIIISEVRRPTCDGLSDGFIDVQWSGGQPPYTFEWSNGMTSSSIDSLPSGKYAVTVSDTNGCFNTSDTIELISKPKINAGIILQKDVKCYGDENGYVRLDAFGGIGNYTYKWQDGFIGAERDHLKSGDYTVLVMDELGCTDSLSIKILESDPLKITLSNKENNRCNAEHQGNIITNTSGGTRPYTYQWSNGEKTDDIYGLKADIYSVIVTDAQACKDTIQSIPILQPMKLEAEVIENRPSSCIKSEDGILILNTMGGTPKYTYYWGHDTDAQDTLMYLNKGIYSVTILDDNDCKTSIDNIVVNSLDKSINLSTQKVDVNRCGRDSLSIISVKAEGGELPLDYNWSSGVNRVKDVLSDTIYSLPGGDYNVTVTDIKGCVGVSDTIKLRKLSPILANASIINNACYGDENGVISLHPSGGEGPYRYSWSNGMSSQTIENLKNDNYSVTITDNINCTYNTPEFSITSPSEITIDPIVIGSEGLSQGKITLNIDGGKPPYEIIWNDDVELNIPSEAINLSEGDYNVTIIDANNCIKEFIVTVPIINNVNNQENQLFTLYPNPSSDGKYYLKLIDLDKIDAIEVFDLHAREVSYIWNKNEISIKQKGLFIIRFTIATKYYYYQVINI